MRSRPVSEPMFSISAIKSLTKALDTSHTLDDHADNHRLAAVLILLFPGQTETQILLTRRTSHLPTHAGQISFPGGSMDPTDPDPVFTALREAQEEVSLDGSCLDVLGVLDVDLLPSGYAVAPVLAVTDEEPELRANPDEVEEIFTIPLSLACNLDAYGTDWLERDGVRREFFTLEHGDYYIWGATARMLRTLAELLGNKNEA